MDFDSYEELRWELTKHRYRYYVLALTTIPDIEYDMLERELRAYEVNNNLKDRFPAVGSSLEKDYEVDLIYEVKEENSCNEL